MHNKVYEHTKFFVEECGERVAGTDNVIKASDYIIDYYKNNGIKVETHDFEVPLCKIKKSQLKININGQWKDIKHTPALFSKSTTEGGITLPLVYAENGSVANLKMQDIKGKAVLICRDVYFVYPDVSMYKRLYEFGAVAVIYTTNDGHADVPYVYSNFETMEKEYTIPTVVIHYNDALKLVQREVNEIHYDVQMEVVSSTCRNTIGILEGSDKKAENIVVCAHLDSSMGSVGATDDVAAVALIMELAKYYNEMKMQGKVPRRTIRFIAWSGHECGLHGSKYYLLDHKEIFENTKFVLNYDVIGNALSNYNVCAGCNEIVEEILNNITNKLELDWPICVGPMVVDTLNFAVKEIPEITLTAGFYGGNHTTYDNMNLISKDGFITPIIFSKEIIDWAANAEKISQGYPQALNEGMKAFGDMYGWGLFNYNI